MAMAVFAMVVMVGPAVGPVLGGWITDNYSWPWIFYVNVPVGIMGILMTLQNVHEPEDVRTANRQRAEQARKNLDLAGIALMAVGIGALQYLFEEGPQKDWFEATEVQIALFVAVFGLAAFVLRELTAIAPVVNLRLFKDPTFASASFIAFGMFGMLMGSMFLLPVFTQESLHYTATLSGLVLMPRTLAMMVVSPIVGRLYNRVQPAFIVGFGVLLFALGSYQLSHVTLQTSSRDMVVPLIVTGAAFACLFVPLTTAALSHIPRHQMADAAGLNSFVRQIGGSIGLTIFASLFTTYTMEARAALAPQLSLLRPEVAAQLGQAQAVLASQHVDPAATHLVMGRGLGMSMMHQATVLSFDRIFLLQGLLFLLVIPLFFFLRVDRSKKDESAD
jgi:DHA2 family multidrug resistance protein